MPVRQLRQFIEIRLAPDAFFRMPVLRDILHQRHEIIRFAACRAHTADCRLDVKRPSVFVDQALLDFIVAQFAAQYLRHSLVMGWQIVRMRQVAA